VEPESVNRLPFYAITVKSYFRLNLNKERLNSEFLSKSIQGACEKDQELI